MRVVSSVALGLALACLGAPLLVDGQAREPVIRDVPMQNGAALRPFHEALRHLEDGHRQQVRIMHWGDSNVAADLWTARARRRLQARFGHGGSGYLVPPPWGSRHDGSVVLRGGRSWQARRLGFARDFGPPDGLWGLAGVAVEGSGRGASLDIDLPARSGGSRIEVHALGRRRSGTLELRLDDGQAISIDTQRPRESLVRHGVALGPGAHRARLQVAGWQPVRVLGLVIEAERPGIVYDVLGINGHRMNAQLAWDRGLLREQLEAREPDLVIFGYGGNEALDRHLDMERYERQLSQGLGRMRSLVPDASCLVVSPVAMCPDNPRNVQVTEIQRRVAPQHGCAFWNTSEVSGGHGSLCQWIRVGGGLVSGDRLHLGRRGYEIVGEQFADALLADL